ncbi:MAG: hypothetical protein AAF533_05245 [Acidobacteriota bacterium]
MHGRVPPPVASVGEVNASPPLLRLCLLASSLLAATMTTQAARFGYPDAGEDPPGWFVLTGPDTPVDLFNSSWGDNRHYLELFIEVTDDRLRVDLFDPGLVNADTVGLDAFFGGVVGTTTFVLFDPGDVELVRLSFGADTPEPGGSNRASVTLYDGPAVPGVHRLLVTMDDSAEADEDINVFGVSVPGHDVYSYWFTGGEVNLAGATIVEPVQVFPWVTHSTAGSVMGTPNAGIDVATHDLDAVARNPPDLRIDTPSGRGADLQASQDSEVFTTQLGGVPVGPMDCSDYGLWAIGVSAVSAGLEGANDINSFNIQVHDYLATLAAGDYPLLPDDPRRPLRLYYPRDDGSPPLKESFVQFARVSEGRDPPVRGRSSTLEITLELRNPTGYDLSSVEAITHLNADSWYSDPVLVTEEGGLTAAIVGREIQVSGRVMAGETGRIVFSTELTGITSGMFAVTGDGSDLQGGALLTEASYDTPFSDPAVRETLGPICQVRTEVVEPSCRAVPVLDGDLQTCPGREIMLTAAGSRVEDCGGVIEYRWLRGGLEIAPYPASDTLLDTPFVDTLYRVEVRCSTEPGCEDGLEQVVTTDLDVPPTPVGPTLRVDKVVPGPGTRFHWVATDGDSYNLRRHEMPEFERATSVVVATVSEPEHVVVGPLITPSDLAFFKVSAVNCAGVEEPAP